MTIQAITDGITEALFQEFGEGYEIYTENVEQGLNEPCFLISCLDHEKNLHIGRLYERNNQFSIQYFPYRSEKQEECFAVSERLYECLEYITVADRLVRGTELQGKLSDDILTFSVNYDVFVLKKQEQIVMNNLDLNTETKG